MNPDPRQPAPRTRQAALPLLESQPSLPALSLEAPGLGRPPRSLEESPWTGWAGCTPSHTFQKQVVKA